MMVYSYGLDALLSLSYKLTITHVHYPRSILLFRFANVQDLSTRRNQGSQGTETV